jgi:hypothetical protein
VPAVRAPLITVPLICALLITAAGCTSTDGAPQAAVPSPVDSATAALCGNLHNELPAKVNGLVRADPEPASELTAAWGAGPAIVLRCGIPRPAQVGDVKADGIGVDGVDWVVDRLDGGAVRFFTTYRKAYIEVTLPQKYAADLTPLIPLAGPITRTVPKSL